MMPQSKNKAGNTESNNFFWQRQSSSIYESTKVVVSSIVYTFLHLEGISDFSDAFQRRYPKYKPCTWDLVHSEVF